MNQITPAPQLDLLPESAPFSPEQRAWLNGFFAGFTSPEGGMGTALSPEQNAAVLGGGGDDGEAPWHDQTLELGARMAMAEGRPLRRRMMAAMAQQDCGQCGYNCNDYAEAIASRKEARLNLCAPGGKDTARMLKALAEELDKGGAPAQSAPTIGASLDISAPPGRSRDNPAQAVFLSRRRLNKEGSEKETWHVEFDLTHSGLDYTPGDSFGVFPKNELGLVDQIIAHARRFSHHAGSRQDVARRAAKRRFAGSRARRAVRSHLLPHRRRKAREGAAARAWGRPRWRRRDAGRSRGIAKIRRRAAASRGFRRSARTVAATPLFDLLLAQGDAGKAIAYGRRRALHYRQAQASWRRFDIPVRTHRGGRDAASLCAASA